MLDHGLTKRSRGAQAPAPPDATAAPPRPAAADPLFPVSERFTSPQGEGKLTGVRSHFIRLHGCNLRCRWCDTPYASWEAGKESRAHARAEAPPPHDSSSPDASPPIPADSPTAAASLPVLHDGARLTGADLIASARASGAEHVVITGGEPLIFPGIENLCRALMAAGLHVTIETAGTVAPRAMGRREQSVETREQSAENRDQRTEIGRANAGDSLMSPSGAARPGGRPTPSNDGPATNAQPPDARAIGLPSAPLSSPLSPLPSPLSPLCSLLSLSPKLASSTPLPGDPRDPTGAWRRRHEQRRLNFPAMQALLDSAPDRQIKFVITCPDDLPEIESVLARLHGWNPEDIFLMPEGVTVPDSETVRWITAAAARRGWQYGRRLHIELFGNTRGT